METTAQDAANSKTRFCCKPECALIAEGLAFQRNLMNQGGHDYDQKKRGAGRRGGMRDGDMKAMWMSSVTMGGLSMWHIGENIEFIET